MVGETRIDVEHAAVTEVLIRTYRRQNQMHAVRLYGGGCPNLAEEGWVPVTQVWVADEWSTDRDAVAAVLVIVGIGIIRLAAMTAIKPMRTLMVTYQRDVRAAG